MSSMIHPRISGLAYSVGAVRSIDELGAVDRIDDSTIQSLRSRGLQNFCVDRRSLPEMCVGVALDSLEKTSLNASAIGAIVFASSNPGWTAEDELNLLRVFDQVGFSRARIIGLSMQGCSGCASALRVASDLIKSTGRVETVLVILVGRTTEGASRLGPHQATVFSDGAASCIMSVNFGALEFIASETMTDISLVRPTVTPLGVQRHLWAGLIGLKEVSEFVLNTAGIQPREVTALFGMNGSAVYLDVIAEATGIPPERVFRDDVAKYGHVYSCDNLISLTNYLDEREAVDGEYYLLCSWSPYVRGAVILRHDRAGTSIASAT